MGCCMCLQLKKGKNWKTNFILPSLYHSSIRRAQLQYRRSLIFFTKIAGDIFTGKVQAGFCSDKIKKTLWVRTTLLPCANKTSNIADKQVSVVKLWLIVLGVQCTAAAGFTMLLSSPWKVMLNWAVGGGWTSFSCSPLKIRHYLWVRVWLAEVHWHLQQQP